MRSFCQARLGTNMGKTQQKMAVYAPRHKPSRLLSFAITGLRLESIRSAASTTTGDDQGPAVRTTHLFLSAFPMIVPSLSWQNDIRLKCFKHKHFSMKNGSKNGPAGDLAQDIQVRSFERPYGSRHCCCCPLGVDGVEPEGKRSPF